MRIVIALAILCLLLATAAFSLLAREWLIEKLAGYDAGMDHQLTMADIKALPDTDAFDPKPDPVRARLRSVPTRPSLRVVPPVADDDWVFDENPFRIPSQRQAGEQS